MSKRDDPPDRAGAAGPGEWLFRFAILADTHINPIDGDSPSPWQTNRLANERARAAVRAINRLAPDFTVHLGDMVHPVPAQESYRAAAEQALAILAGLEAPIHYVPGNHDVGDKPLDWMPAEVVSAPFICTYERHFGSDHYHFDYRDCRFVALNAQILNSGAEREANQWRWLEDTLSDARSRRVFVFSHYPPYVANADENEHYDNLGQPARGRLLDLLADHRAEACFSAHVHNFFYDRRAGTDLYVLPAVSAVRHDYSELFRVAPADHEYGRDDSAKLGFFVVDVHARGHVAHYVRSHGATLSAADTRGDRAQTFHVPRMHARLRAPCPVGVDMRQAWAQAIAITPSGAVDEFYRKMARNDYVLAALWEMGIRKLRVPLDDLLDPEARQRLAVLREVGHEILLYSFDVPQGSVVEPIIRDAALFDALELIVPSGRIAGAIPEIASLGARTGLPAYLSRLRNSAEAAAVGAKYTHFISHGFRLGEEDVVASVMDLPGAADALAGLVFRIAASDDPAAAIAGISALARRLGTRAVAHVTLADENPALLAGDERATANRVACSLLAASAHRDACSAYLDTLADIDRGYFPRLGLVDGRCNPRRAGRVFASLQAELASLGAIRTVEDRDVEGGRVLVGQLQDGVVHLVLPSTDATVTAIRVSRPPEPTDARIVDLENDSASTARWTPHGDQRHQLQVLARDRPFLVISPSARP